MKVLLVTNYRKDRQQSMLRFGKCLAEGLAAMGLGVVESTPLAYFGSLPVGSASLRKWNGYIDKFVLYPVALRRAVRRLRGEWDSGARCVGHVVDHSNAMYARWLRDAPHVVTCNDLLAVRSARGEFCVNQTQWSGRRLQQWILSSLNGAQRVACISEATQRDLRRLSALRDEQTSVIHMGLTYPYSPMGKSDAKAVVERLLGDRLEKGVSYVLHVGGGQWYKNRANVARLWQRIRVGQRRPSLLYVGPAPDRELRTVLGGESPVCFLDEVGDEELRALYSAAEALLFPSLEEGFGWPIVEAQACGCPVITTHKVPMTEVGGEGPLYLEEAEISGSDAGGLQRGSERISALLGEPDGVRERRRAAGFANVRRFSAEKMLREYVALYETAVTERRSALN